MKCFVFVHYVRPTDGANCGTVAGQEVDETTAKSDLTPRHHADLINFIDTAGVGEFKAASGRFIFRTKDKE